MSEPAVTLVDAAAALRRGDLTSAGLLERMTARADAVDDELGVYLTRFDESARESARRADADFEAGIDRGLLQGLPVAIKDIVASAEGATTAQSLVLDRTWGRGRDAVVVERLRHAGAVITGKVTTMEFACGVPDPEKPFPLPRNPWDLDRWTGGSSSGSGSGVAAGLFLAAVGTDTAGSIRVPASYCGVCGLLPTFGRVPNAGCVPLGFSLDHIGPLARSARDCGAVLTVLAGPDRRDAVAVDEPVPDYLAGLDGSLAGVRVGLERAHHFGVDDDPALEQAFGAAAAVLESRGATIVETVLPHYAEAVTAQLVTMFSEALAYHREDFRRRPQDYFSGTQAFIEMGALFSGADYVQAQRVRRLTQRALAEVFVDVDVVAMPTVAGVAPDYETVLAGGTPRILEGVVSRHHTAYWNAVGNPALAVPMGLNAEGLPLSLQLAARPFEEALLIRVGDAYQQATDWHLREPPLLAAYE